MKYKTFKINSVRCLLIFLFTSVFCAANVLNAEASGYEINVNIPVKVVETTSNSRIHGAYELEIEALNKGNPMPVNNVISMAGGGESAWSIMFNKPGFYEYKVSQRIKNEKGVSYDKSYYKATVFTDFNSENKIIALIYAIKDETDSKVEAIEFRNEIKMVNALENKDINTGDNIKIHIWLMLLLSSIAMITMLVVSRRIKRQRYGI